MPKEYRFAGTEVKVKHTGNAVLLMPSDQPWGILPTALSLFEPGFTLERSQPDAFKPMPTIGKGVEELRISDDSGTYRVI